MEFDQSSWPDQGRADTQIFRPSGNAAQLNWARWKKPNGCSMVFIFGGGGGGGGGNGFTRTAGNPGGGGGGGCGGCVASLVIPAMFLPPELFVFVGRGGAAAAAGANTWISPVPANTSNLILFVANGGVAGNSGTAGAGGAATTGVGPALYQGITLGGAFVDTSSRQGFAPQPGLAGGSQAGAVGASNAGTAGDWFQFGGGCGGAGCTTANFAGGGITSLNTTVFPTMAGGTSGGGNGQNGIQFPGRWEFTAGAGGGSNNSGVAGHGGMGGLCCGGGGGGAGATGGPGGQGGDGVVVIVAW